MASVVTVSEVESGTRVLRWFLRHYPGMPQRDFYKLCRGGQIRINSSRCKGTEVLSGGDVIRIPPTLQSYREVKKTETGSEFSMSDLEVLRKSIIYDDSDMVVFNKPAGLAVQGGTGIKKSVDKMAAALFPYDKISLVHRIDRETSGLLVVAKNQNAAQKLAYQFQNKIAHKEYLALLQGNIAQQSGTIDNFVAKGAVFEDDKKIPDGVSVQRAITDYKVLSSASGLVTWVLFLPRTGRTHQLRLHSAFSLHAPIIGDDLYGKHNQNLNKTMENIFKNKKLFLFAYKITLRHPGTGKNVTFTAELPEFMKSVISFLEFPIP